MKEKTDSSYGVVPVFNKDGVWQVLLVHQISYRGDAFWILPKGHAEAGEDPVTAALRELEEETGIKNATLKNVDPLTISYSFVHEGVKINKTVEYYIGVCEDTVTEVTQPQEIKEVRWCTFHDAIELATHENTKDVLRKTEALLLQ